jgi:hypothetical protein
MLGANCQCMFIDHSVLRCKHLTESFVWCKTRYMSCLHFERICNTSGMKHNRLIQLLYMTLYLHVFDIHSCHLYYLKLILAFSIISASVWTEYRFGHNDTNTKILLYECFTVCLPIIEHGSMFTHIIRDFPFTVTHPQPLTEILCNELCPATKFIYQKPNF